MSEVKKFVLGFICGFGIPYLTKVEYGIDMAIVVGLTILLISMQVKYRQRRSKWLVDR